MKKSLAIFCITAVVMLVLVYLFQPDVTLSDNLNFTVQNIKSFNENSDALLDDTFLPAVLNYKTDFKDIEAKRDFSSSLDSSVKSGYYSRPQTIYFNTDSTVFYTTDGTLPTEGSLKYDGMKGIDISDNTLICASEYNNGKFGEVKRFSYVILKDTTDYKCAYGYNTLSNADKAIYNVIYDAMESFEKKIVFGNRGLSYTKIQRLVRCVNYDNPLLFQAPLAVFSWHGTADNVTSITISYDYTSYETASYRKMVEERVDGILQKADGSVSLVEYIDKIRTDIMLSAAYDDTLSRKNSYECIGVLLDKYGVCESYSRAFQYACQRIGVNCMLVVGQSEGEGHMWNMLMLENDWYHMDLTWDDGLYNTVYSDYFNLSDRVLMQYGDRTIDPVANDNMHTIKLLDFYNVYPIPKAEGEKYSYYNYILYYCSNS